MNFNSYKGNFEEAFAYICFYGFLVDFLFQGKDDALHFFVLNWNDLVKVDNWFLGHNKDFLILKVFRNLKPFDIWNLAKIKKDCLFRLSFIILSQYFKRVFFIETVNYLLLKSIVRFLFNFFYETSFLFRLYYFIFNLNKGYLFCYDCFLYFFNNFSLLCCLFNCRKIFLLFRITIIRKGNVWGFFLWIHFRDVFCSIWPRCKPL